MKLYETTFILDPELKDDGWESAIAKYSGVINQAGSIKNTYRWGLRRMAYEILNQTHGYYVHIIHESESSIPTELERQFKLDESCLRYLTVVADNPKYLEELDKGSAQQATEHASSGSGKEGGSESGGRSESDEPDASKPESGGQHDEATAREES